MNRDMYFSVDIESDGEAPGTASMLSIGIIALDPVTLEECGSFYRTLKRLPEAQPNNRTMEWWDQFPKQWAEARANAIEPEQAMRELHEFVVETGKQAKRRHSMEKGPIPVFVAYPAGFDFSFVFYYLHRFLKESVFSFSALDMKSLAMGYLGCGFTEVKKDNYPKSWHTELPHDHNALNDARSQADILVRMLRWREVRAFYEPQTESADRIVPPRAGHACSVCWDGKRFLLGDTVANCSRCVRASCDECANGKNLGELSEQCPICGRRGGSGL
jgi:hypothetical protein